MSSPSSPPSHRLWWIAVCLVGGLWLASVPRTWQVEGVDEIEYLSLAHSLGLGMGYTMYGEPHVYYPPLYPAVFAAALKVFPHECWRAFYGVNALAGVLALGGFGAWLRTRFGRAGAWAAWLSLFSYYGWSFSTRFLLSEPLYLVFSLAGIALAHEAVTRDGPAPRRIWAGLALAALGAAATRSASIALAAGIGGAAAALFVQGRRGRAIALALAGVLPLLAFNAAWQARADRVNPQAGESYLRWAKRFLGVGGDRQAGSVVDRNQGEGIAAEDNRWSRRALLLAEKTGQVLLSAPRVGPAFRPLGVFLALLVGAGILRELRARPASPAAWVALVSLLMFSLTSWVSSYLRYLYTLLPLLFLFAAGGLRMLVEERVRAPAGAVMGVFGLWCLEAAGGQLIRDPAPVGGEAMYAFALALGVALSGVALLVLAAVWLRRTFRADPGPPPAPLAWAVLILLTLHNGALAAQRVRLTLSDASLVEKELTAVFTCAREAAKRLPPDAKGVSAYPMLLRYVMDRELTRPADCRALFAGGADFAITVGIISHVPGVDWTAEECLRQELMLGALGGRYAPLVREGRAGVYLPAAAAR